MERFNFKGCLLMIAIAPKVLNRANSAWSETLTRLRAAGLVAYGDPPVLTAEGLAYCRANGIKTPQEVARERELQEKADRAIAILEEGIQHAKKAKWLLEHPE